MATRPRHSHIPTISARMRPREGAGSNPPMDDLVFHDPTGRRAKRARLTAGLLVSLGALVAAAFFATLAIAPRLPSLALRDPRSLQALHVETPHEIHARKHWTKVAHPHPAATAAATHAPLSIG